MKKKKKIWHQKMSSPRSKGVQYAIREEQRMITKSSRKNEVTVLKWKRHSVVDASSGESKVWCCKEQYCTGTWDVTNQGTLNMVRKEMERVNISILGISELKWKGMGKFSSDDHYIYRGFPGGSNGKESARNVGDLGWIPGWGRSPREGNGNPL